MLFLLDQTLVRNGDSSVVIAMEGSCLAGTLVPTPAFDGCLDAQVCSAAQQYVRDLIKKVLALNAIDLIHFHGVDFPHYLPETNIPIVVTLHLPTSLYQKDVFHRLPSHSVLVCVSRAQQRDCPAPCLVIPNGIRVEDFLFGVPMENYALVLSRICPEKGVHRALDAAGLADVPLLIAGQVFGYPEHASYFETEIRPRLNHSRQFIGPATLEQKRDLLARARCVLIPSVINETSSLVAMEALASGTPVIGFRRGALVELIQPGITGFLVDNVAEMAVAIEKIHIIDRAKCRAYAVRHFNAEQCTGRYLAIYRRLCADSRRISPCHSSAELGERTNIDGRAGVVRADPA